MGSKIQIYICQFINLFIHTFKNSNEHLSEEEGLSVSATNHVLLELTVWLGAPEYRVF
jgi:hypothetical protein